MQFIVYSFIGGIGMLSDFAVFYLFVEIDVNYQIANVIGYAAGTSVSFGLQRRVTFGIRDRIFIRLLLFIIVAGIGYTVSALLLWLFVELNGLNVQYSKLLTLPVVAILQYLLNRNITFKG